MPDTVPDELRTEIVVTLRSAGAGFALLHGSRVTGTPCVDSDLDVAAWWPAGASLQLLLDAASRCNCGR